MNAPRPPGHFFFFVGKIASGKGTQTALLADALGYAVFATGARFRDMISSGSELGERMKKTYDAGLLMPAWVANYLFEEFVFNLPHEQGAVFEGSGRDVDQAKVIEEVCAWLSRPYTVLNLAVSDETVVRRSLGRARDKTDDETVVRKRLAEYARLTEPAIEYFRARNALVDIDGEASPEAVHDAVIRAVRAALGAR